MYEIFKCLCVSKPKIRHRVYHTGNYKNKKRIMISFKTISLAQFLFYHHQFYKDNIKKVPKLIHPWLTPISLAYWYMDDGSIKDKKK